MPRVIGELARGFDSARLDSTRLLLVSADVNYSTEELRCGLGTHTAGLEPRDPWKIQKQIRPQKTWNFVAPSFSIGSEIFSYSSCWLVFPLWRDKCGAGSGRSLALLRSNRLAVFYHCLPSLYGVSMASRARRMRSLWSSSLALRSYDHGSD